MSLYSAEQVLCFTPSVSCRVKLERVRFPQSRSFFVNVPCSFSSSIPRIFSGIRRKEFKGTEAFQFDTVRNSYLHWVGDYRKRRKWTRNGSDILSSFSSWSPGNFSMLQAEMYLFTSSFKVTLIKSHFSDWFPVIFLNFSQAVQFSSSSLSSPSYSGSFKSFVENSVHSHMWHGQSPRTWILVDWGVTLLGL